MVREGDDERGREMMREGDGEGGREAIHSFVEDVHSKRGLSNLNPNASCNPNSVA